jgi:hypothetical protein
MTDTAGDHLTEEPQSERGPMGSRDTGSDEPGAGPADRPEGRAEGGADSDSQVDPQAPEHGGPDLQTGDGGG